MASGGPANPEQVAVRVKSLINNQLKQVLKKEGLPVSGAKATLQTRIIDQLMYHARNNNMEGFGRLRTLVYNPDADPIGLSPSPSTPRVYPNNPQPPPNHYQHSFSSSAYRPGPPNMPPTTNGPGSRSPQFKNSPFYSIVEPLTPVLECKVRDTTRDTVESTINLRSDLAERLSRDETIKAMIYCAADPMSPFSRVDIEFPYQIEIKVNQDEVKANLRGLKNKPGTTRPADITNLLRHKANYNNYMVITYALTKKRFFVVVNLVRCHPVNELVAKLKSGKTIAKDQVVREMISRAEDADIVTTSSVMSLKCPLSTVRIDVPCRSSICSHNQCFDARSFLQLQQQAPTWTCPVCNKAVAYEHLQVDQYVDDILRSTPKSVDQVIIEPNGKWSQTSGKILSPPRTCNCRNSSDGEEELVEIKNASRLASMKREGTREPDLMRSPPTSSRENSTSSIAALPALTSSNKRSAGQLVDLTLSSDEDDKPPRPAKLPKSSINLPKLLDMENAPKRPHGLSSQHPSNHLNTPNPPPKDYGQPPRP